MVMSRVSRLLSPLLIGLLGPLLFATTSIPATPPASVDSGCIKYIYTPKTRLEKISEHAAEIQNYKFVVNDTKEVTVYYTLPKKITGDTKVFVVMHGMKRNGKTYAEIFRYLSEKENIAVITPEFRKDMFPVSEYQRANISKNLSNPESGDLTYHVVDKIFEDVIKRFGLQTRKYILYGHSAGGQFTARAAMFSDSKYLDYAIAAAAGTYTFLNENMPYPHGIKDLAAYRSIVLRNIGERELYILIGNADTSQDDPRLHKSFHEQGKHRYERAINFFNTSKAYSESHGGAFAWRLVVMDGVGHNSRRTLPYVLDIISGKYN